MSDFTPDEMEILVALLALGFLSGPDERCEREDGNPSRWQLARDINEGACGSFAEDLCEILVEGGVFDAFPLDGSTVGETAEGVHCWTYWRGRHYDAEVPWGVEDWRDLPFWSRYGVPETRQALSDQRAILDVLAAIWIRVRLRIRQEVAASSP